ncbi:MAG: formylglycine-generating enzyme family protein, partial [Pseudomonadota bacterium]
YDNIGDADARARWPNWETTACSDGKIFTGPAGSYEPNGFGVHDIYGNVREWVGDCWHNNYERAPSTSQAWIDVGCTNRVVRGGSWDSKPSLVASSWRLSLPADTRHFLYGFRVARELR